MKLEKLIQEQTGIKFEHGDVIEYIFGDKNYFYVLSKPIYIHADREELDRAEKLIPHGLTGENSFGRGMTQKELNERVKKDELKHYPKDKYKFVLKDI